MFRHRIKRLKDLFSVTFVIPQDVPRMFRDGNIVALPQHSDFYHPDLVAAVDVVIGKLGYSTLAEVGHSGKPFGYVVREECAESGPLEAFAVKHLQGKAIMETDFSSGQWIESLTPLLDMETTSPAFPNDAKMAAAIILETVSDAAGPGKAPSISFDPFGDRKSRDIRNRLSKEFVEALQKRSLKPVCQAAEALVDVSGEKKYKDYIQDRLARYSKVLGRIQATHLRDPKRQALCIWNAGLFFECHEHLEMIWQSASGEERKALQGFIKAAGVFVHRGLGRDAPASRLAPKALELVLSCREQLSFIENLEDLIVSLNNHGAVAPQLKGT